MAIGARGKQRSMASIIRNRRAKHIERETFVREREKNKALAERTKSEETVNEGTILRRSLFKEK